MSERVILREACMAMLQDLHAKDRVWANTEYAKEIKNKTKEKRKFINEMHAFLGDSSLDIIISRGGDR